MTKIDWYDEALRRAAAKRQERRDYKREQKRKDRLAAGMKPRRTLAEAIKAKEGK